MKVSFIQHAFYIVIRDVTYQTRETVFHRDILTPKRAETTKRSGLRGVCDEIRGVWIANKKCLDCLIYLLNRNKN